MGQTNREINIESAAYVGASADDAWKLMTHKGKQRHAGFGVEEITYRPDNTPTIEQGMEIRLKVGIAAIRGLVRVCIDDFDIEQRYFTASIIEAPFGIQGDATIAVSDLECDEHEASELLFIGSFTIPRLMARFVNEERIQHVADTIMPKIGELIAKQAQRLRYGSVEQDE